MKAEKSLLLTSRIVKFFLAHDFSKRLEKDVQEWIVNDVQSNEEGSGEFWNELVSTTQNTNKDYNRVWAKIATHAGLDLNKKTPRKIHAPFYRRTLLRVAAVLVPLLVVTGVLLNTKMNVTAPEYLTEKTVPVGQSEEIVLADGSHVTLDGGSTLTYTESKDGKSRVANLKGKAKFDVTHNQGKPFYVNTDHMTVKVLGTNFDVEEHSGNNMAVVTLNSGRVEVSANARSYVLEPGDRLEYDIVTGNASVIGAADQSQSAATAADSLNFEDGATIKDIVSALEAKYGVTIEVPDRVLSQRDQYSISFDQNDDLQSVMSVLKDVVDGLSFKITDK